MTASRAALIAEATARLAAAGVPGPERDARLIARWAGGLTGAGLATRLAETPGPEEARRFETAVARRAAREPLSHITGTRAFWGRDFRVTRDVLDPRPETETLIATAFARPGPPPARILDLGTGSGAILVTLLAEWPEAEGLGVDLSERALAIAAENAAAHGVEQRLRLVRSDWFDAVEGRFDLVVCNPPYIASDEMAGLAPEVRLHEPASALSPGGDGLDAYRALAAGVAAHLAPGGQGLFEIGPTQAEAVMDILAAAGLGRTECVPDLDGRNRVIRFSSR